MSTSIDLTPAEVHSLHTNLIAHDRDPESGRCSCGELPLPHDDSGYEEHLLIVAFRSGEFHAIFSDTGIVTPVVHTDGGPWAKHNYACPICWQEKAILNLNTGVFEPCWRCHRLGWTINRRRKRLRWLPLWSF